MFVAATLVGVTWVPGILSTRTCQNDDMGNAAPAETVFKNTESTIVKLPAGKLAVIEGLKDYIVVDTDDVCWSGHATVSRR